MKTLAANLQITTSTASVRDWAFSAAVRLADQDKPIALKLLVEVAIAIRMLAVLAKKARCPAGQAAVARRAPRTAAHGARRAGKAVPSTPVTVRSVPGQRAPRVGRHCASGQGGRRGPLAPYPSSGATSAPLRISVPRSLH